MLRLPDVLSVVLIMVITAILLAPALARISQDKQNAVCRDHLRLLIQAVHAYADAHNGALPDSVDRTTRTWTWWFDRARPYVERNRWFYCPAKSPEVFNQNGEADPLAPEAWDHTKLAYGMNWRLDRQLYDGQAVQREAIDEPARLIVLGDAEFYQMRATASMWPRDASVRHAGQANFAFLDGHVELADPQPDKASGPKAEGILNDKHWRP